MRKLSLVTLIALMAGVALAEGLPENLTIDGCAKKKAPVEFPHQVHMGLAECTACHHTAEGLTAENFADMKVESCSSCHAAPEKAETPDCTKSSKKTNPFHILCIGCHKDAMAEKADLKIPAKCNECHPKEAKG